MPMTPKGKGASVEGDQLGFVITLGLDSMEYARVEHGGKVHFLANQPSNGILAMLDAVKGRIKESEHVRSVWSA